MGGSTGGGEILASAGLTDGASLVILGILATANAAAVYEGAANAPVNTNVPVSESNLTTSVSEQLTIDSGADTSGITDPNVNRLAENDANHIAQATGPMDPWSVNQVYLYHSQGNVNLNIIPCRPRSLEIFHGQHWTSSGYAGPSNETVQIAGSWDFIFQWSFSNVNPNLR